jgi:hypothetical protein
MDFWRYAGLIGELAQPIGERHLEFISEAQGKSDQIDLAGAKYILWDASVALPTNMESMALSISPAAGYVVLSLP